MATSAKIALLTFNKKIFAQSATKTKPENGPIAPINFVNGGYITIVTNILMPIRKFGFKMTIHTTVLFVEN